MSDGIFAFDALRKNPCGAAACDAAACDAGACDSPGLPWEILQRQLTWRQLGFIHGLRVLDYGSGRGVTANHFAADNDVVAIEPDGRMLRDRCANNRYTQLTGGLGELVKLGDASFDAVLCHNVLEYACERREIVRQFARVLKPGGRLSVLKHNRAGRVMQSIVLLNDFRAADRLLAGGDGCTARFGPVHYYDDGDISRWAPCLITEKILGMRVFWDLQQDRRPQTDPEWLRRMLRAEEAVSGIEQYRAVAFFHHVMLRRA
jgi:S-adenosylmethionine-dependent methyltransferase